MDNPLFELLAYYVDIKNIDSIKHEATTGISGFFTPFIITSGGVALLLIATTRPDETNTGTHYDDWYGQIFLMSFISGVVSGFTSGISQVIYEYTHSYVIHGEIDQYQKYLRGIKNDSAYPDLPPPEIFRVLQKRKEKNL